MMMMMRFEVGGPTMPKRCRHVDRYVRLNHIQEGSYEWCPELDVERRVILWH